MKELIPRDDIEKFDLKMELLRIKTEKEMKKAALKEELHLLASMRKAEEFKETLEIGKVYTDEDPKKGPPLFHRVWRKVHP